MGIQSTNKELRAQARESLKGKWVLAMGTVAVFMLIVDVLVLIPIYGWIINLIIAGLLAVGLSGVFISLSRNQDARFAQLFDGFKPNKLLIGFVAALLIVICTFLWTLLLVIPGIIAVFSYAMTFLIIAADEWKGIHSTEAINTSKEMMRGNKWRFFCGSIWFLFRPYHSC